MVKHSKDAIEVWLEQDVHIASRTLYIGDFGDITVGSELAATVIKAFHLFNTSSVDKPVTVYLNTTGGDWYHGLAMYDSIIHAQSEVHIYGIGQVMSMGSIIMQAATERWMYPSSTMLIHDGFSGYYADARSSLSWAKYEERSLEYMYNIYSSRSGKPASLFKDLCSHDTLLTAKEAKELGLIDYIVGEDGDA